jgi:hypothetical protein
MIALSRSGALVKAPRGMRSCVISAKRRSAWLSQEAEVGVKCRWKRGFFLEPSLHLRVLVGGVVVHDHTQYLERGSHFPIAES